MWVRNLLLRSSAYGILLLFGVGCSDMHQHTPPYERDITGKSLSQKESVSIPSTGIHKWTQQPYRVLGETYYPKIDPLGSVQEGIASWYGPDFHGKKTSSGEVYNMHDLSAAHKTLPMNTKIRVTNTYNKKSIVVRVNDRGPFVAGRIVDLSYGAGKTIGLDRTGIAPVVLEVLEYDSVITASLGSKPLPVAKAKLPDEKPQEAKNQVVAPVAAKAVVLAEAQGPLYFVQLGSFQNEEGAKKLKTGAAFVFSDRDVTIKTASRDTGLLYKVYVGGFKDADEAHLFIEKNSISGARVALEE
jgi:rare lipoprotein A